MKIDTVTEALSGNSYPGRGIIVGRSKDGSKSVIVYFIMGRSLNSRNRVFTEVEDGIMTEAYDPSKMSDPSLIIYHPVRFLRRCCIVTNGDQTDTIRNGLAAGKSFRHALLTREFEPDGPNYTPRISAIVLPDGSYKLSILKSLYGDPSCCCRYFYEYDKPAAGVGHMIHTYKGDGEPLPSFEGEPKPVAVTGSLNEYANAVWGALDADNRVSLYACSIDRVTGETESIIINKYN
jgi:hypothetical protein